MLADAVADAGLPRDSALPPAETTLAERAPGVVWGMPDLAPAPAATPTQVAEVETAPSVPRWSGYSGVVRASADRAALGPGWSGAHPRAARRQPAEPPPRIDSPRLAGRAPGVVWGMPDMAPAQPGDAPPSLLHGSRKRGAAPGAGQANGTAGEMVLAGEAATPAPTTPAIAPAGAADARAGQTRATGARGDPPGRGSGGRGQRAREADWRRRPRRACAAPRAGQADA